MDYLRLLIDGDADGVVDAFAGEPVIEDPRAGRVAGADHVRRFVKESAAWLAERDARVEPARTTSSAERDVVESVLHLRLDHGPWPLPVAVVADREGDAVRELRVYHSTWPLTGGHVVRRPMLPPDPSIELSDAVAAYQRALAAGDLDGVLAVYDPTGSFREPAGGTYLYEGTERLREEYTIQFALGGGIPLQFCTATDDGTTCAIEFVVDRIGTRNVAPQAGCAVYERGTPGHLAAGRVYDDVHLAERDEA